MSEHGIPARAFMAAFSSGSRGERKPGNARKPAEDRGIPVDVYREGKWIKIWSKTGAEVKW